jgi:hypothetical protein
MRTAFRFAVIALRIATLLNAAQRPSAATLAQAAQTARLDQIDDFRKECGDERTLAEWLKQLLGDTAAAVKRSGGKCQPINKQNPLDGGGG